MKKWISSFRLRFNLVTLLLVIGSVAFFLGRVTDDRGQAINRNLEAQQRASTASSGNIQFQSHQPNWKQIQTEPRYPERQVKQRFASQASVTPAVVDY
jgi:hypothetical protein